MWAGKELTLQAGQLFLRSVPTLAQAGQSAKRYNLGRRASGPSVRSTRKQDADLFKDLFRIPLAPDFRAIHAAGE